VMLLVIWSTLSCSALYSVKSLYLLESFDL
jgi:hypothetical protein